MTGGPSPEDVLWRALDTAWSAAGRPSAEELVRRAAAEHDHDLALRTVQGWLARQHVPRLDARSRRHFEVFVDVLRAGSVEDWEPLLRAAGVARRGSERPRRGGPGPAPAQLPPDVRAFVGRSAELAELDQVLADGRPEGDGDVPEPLPIAVVSGTAGVGKTGLAVHWANRSRSRFPDGQLYVDLRGHDPGPPLSPADALTHLLRSLGADPGDLPPGVDERAALLRTLLDGRRVLVVLDNASSAEQVRPLLPGTSTNSVLVTSRDSLAGLVARHGARRLDLDVLPAADARQLLLALIGDRAAAEPAATALLADQCVRLPLALRVAAELVAGRPDLTVAAHVRDLTDEERRLELLDAGADPRTEVRAVLSWSHRHLPADAARLWRSLGLLPGPEFDTGAAAALIDADPSRAGRLLAVLASAHLVEPAGPDRHRLHDLLRACAARLAREQDPAVERRAAVVRLLDHYAAAASAAAAVLFPAGSGLQPDPEPAPGRVRPPESPAAALSWLEAERANLVAGCRLAEADGLPRQALRIAGALSRYLDTRGYFDDAAAVHGYARPAARRSADPAAEARALSDLAATRAGQGAYAEAVEHLTAARVLYRRAGDRGGEASVLSSLGAVAAGRGDFAVAAEHVEEALTLLAELEDPAGQARALSNLGGVRAAQGRYAEAVAELERSRELFRATGDHGAEARVAVNLGAVEEQRGRTGPAAAHYRQALRLLRGTGDRIGEANVLGGLAGLHAGAGRPAAAGSAYRRSLRVFRDIGDRAGEARTLNAWGRVLATGGDEVEAIGCHGAARALAVRIGDQHETARADHGLARAYRPSDPDRARQHLEAAIALYERIDVAELDEARALLHSLPGPRSGT